MTQSYNSRKKAKKKNRTKEQKDVARKIRKGVYPRYCFITSDMPTNNTHRQLKKSQDGGPPVLSLVNNPTRLERVKGKLTWRTVSVYRELTEDLYEENTEQAGTVTEDN